MTCFLNPLPSLDTVLRRSLYRGKKERETVYVSVVEAAGGRLAEFSASDPRRLANLFSRGLEFTQTARVVTPTAATERESEQEVPWHAARHVTTSVLVLVQPSVFFFFLLWFSVFSPTVSLVPPIKRTTCREVKSGPWWIAFIGWIWHWTLP